MMQRKICSLLAALLLSMFSLPTFAEIPQGSVAFSATDTETVRKQKTEYNNAWLTCFAVIASAAAYAPEQGGETAYLRSYGWDFVPRQATAGKTAVHFITAKNRMADGTPLYVIAFRGTADKKDWAADFKTERVVYGGSTLAEAEKTALGGLRTGNGPTLAEDAAQDVRSAKSLPKVHKGFNEYADTALRSLLDPETKGFLDEYRSEANARLLLTGHSLGGAVATIVGQRLIDFGFAPERIQVITFGAPAVANKTFEQLYGERLNLIRVTNTADPIPLTLQAVLRKYKQFGEEVRFRIPRTVSSMTHFMNLYLDAGMRNYYQAFDALEKAGVIREWPDTLLSDTNQPVVLLYIKENSAKGETLKNAMGVLQRFMLNEYKALFPNYIVVKYPEDALTALRKYKAAYLLTLEFETNASREDNSWFLTLAQTLSDQEGRLLAAGSVAKRTSPEAGNILAAMEAVRVQRSELLKHMPWLVPAPQEIPKKFLNGASGPEVN